MLSVAIWKKLSSLLSPSRMSLISTLECSTFIAVIFDHFDKCLNVASTYVSVILLSIVVRNLNTCPLSKGAPRKEIFVGFMLAPKSWTWRRTAFDFNIFWPFERILEDIFCFIFEVFWLLSTRLYRTAWDVKLLIYVQATCQVKHFLIR
jgi:hypothetical protein